MHKYLLLLTAVFSSLLLKAQTFNGTGGAIPDAGATPTCFPINVTGIGTIDALYGLATVCINVTHTYDGDINIVLTAPDGTSIPLSMANGGTGDNFNNTCFSMSATVDVSGASAPFSGTYIPDGNMGMANNGQSGTGTWNLCIQDLFGGEVGTLNSWSLTFNNTPAPPAPVIPGCAGNPPAGDACDNATPVCNFDGYCGNTSSYYNIDIWDELDNAFCGTIENNSFITFVASATTANFNVFVSNSTDGNGIQMFFYDGGCGSGAINTYGCYNLISTDVGAVPITATGLTPGNTYYLMFDGYAGDVCDYSIVPLDGVNILAVNPPNASICIGQSVILNASGGNGTYNWTGVGVTPNTGAVVTVTPVVTTTYTVTSIDPTGSCPITKDVVITITNEPPPPTVTSPVTLCQGSAATALTANGALLSWFTAATGGTGTATAPTPSTTTVGTTTYYVSQTLICGESVRVPVIVNVVAVPAAPSVTTPLTYCQGASATALTATGSGLLWYTAATGGTGSATAPVPSTTTTGTTTYYVSQSVATCQGPRVGIVVNVTAIPGAPVVTTPVSYCQGNTATPLTAAGTNLLWYTSATGGAGNATAPTPSTTNVGTTTWYVSQATGTCRGPRTPVVVNVAVSTPAPTVTAVNYCQGNTASALTATGTSLLWYTAATGGTGSATAPLPSTTVSGTTTYYVTQTLSCGESIRTPLPVNVTAAPAAPTVTTAVVYCQGSTASALTATGTALLWYTAASGGTGSATVPVPSTATVGSTNYYVSQTIGCEGPRALITVTVRSIPAAPGVTTPVTHCQGSTSAALTATGSGLLWYTAAAGGTGNATAPTPTTTMVGSTTYYVSQTVATCQGPRSPVTVTILPSTPAPTATTPVVYCQGTTATALTATGTGLLWYTAATGGTGTAAAPVPSTAVTGSTTYYVTQTTSPCGESVRKAIVVTINPTPAAPVVTTPVIFCQGSDADELNATGTSLLWYNTATGGTGTAVQPIPSTATTGNTIFYVSQTTGTCEGPRAAITVRINSIPLAPAVTATITYCQSVAASVLSATGSNLLWYTSATGGSGSSTAPTPSTNTAGTVTYYVSQTVNSCEGPRSAIAVTTLPATPAPAAVSPVVYCQGTTPAALTATGTGLLWYTAATGGTGTSSAPTPSTTATGNTTYYVTQTLAPCGESVRKAIVVTINSTPAAPAVTSPVVYCQGTSAIALTATGTSLTWYTASSGGTGSSVAPTPSTTTTGNTVYYVSQKTGACEGPRVAITVTVNAIPPAPGVTASFSYCKNAAASPLSATGSNLLWYTVATGGSGSSAAPTPSTATAGTKTYYVTQTISSCESPRAAIVVTTLPPTAAPTAAAVTYCQGTTAVALTATGTGLLWYTAATGGTGSATAPVPSTATAGNITYYVSQTASPCGESARTALVVTIDPTPAAPTVGGPMMFCQDVIVDPLTATGTSLLWYASAIGGTGTATAPSAYTENVGVTTYYVSQTTGICEGPRATITVTINTYPDFGPDIRDTVCAGDSVDLANMFTTTGYTYNWTLDGKPINTPGAVKVSGAYQLEAINTNGCADTVIVYVTIQPPVIAFAGMDTIAIKGAPHQLMATGGVAFTWSPAAPLNMPNIQNPVATLDHDQQFQVTVTDAAGCSGSDIVFVQVYEGPTYYVPNAFSPNGDGLNDVFRVVPVGITRTDWFRVFNRFGQLVFETNQWLKGWDGSYLGKKQPVGNYVWIVKGVNRYGKIVEMKGTVMIVQ